MNEQDAFTTFAGTYTMAFQYAGNNGATTPPGGTSIGSATIKPDGVMSAKGTLADGTKFSISARPSEDGTYRFFFSPHKTVGSYFTTMFRLTERSDGWFHVADDQGTARWAKSPNIKDKSYREGFDASFDTLVVQWIPPGTGETLRDVLGLGSTKILDIDFFDGLSPITYASFLPTSLGLNLNNTFRVASALGGPSVSDDKSWAKIFSGKVDPKTGLITVTLNITVSNDLRELTFNGRKIPLAADSRPVALVYTDATKSPTNNLTVTLYLNGSGVVQSLATQYFQVSGFTLKIRNHTSYSIRKN